MRSTRAWRGIRWTDWRWLSERSGLPVFHQTGVLFFFQRVEPYVTQSIEVHKRLKLPTRGVAARGAREALSAGELGRHRGRAVGAALGALMARRAVQTLVAEFVKAGGEYRIAAVAPPAAAGPVRRSAGTRGSMGFARLPANASRRAICVRLRPWLPKVFPERSARAFFRLGRKSSSSRRKRAITRFAAGPPADVGGLQQRRHLLRHAGSRGARLQDRARQARPGDRSGHRRPHSRAPPRSRTCARS